MDTKYYVPAVPVDSTMLGGADTRPEVEGPKVGDTILLNFDTRSGNVYIIDSSKPFYPNGHFMEVEVKALKSAKITIE